MEILITDAGPSKKNIKLNIPVEEIQKKYKEKLDMLRESAFIKGFRSGKTPISILEKKFGKDILNEMKVNYILEGYDKLIKEHKIQPMKEPDIREENIILQKNQACTIEFSIEIFPEFKLPEYKGLEVKRPVVKVSNKDVDNAILELRKMRAELIVEPNTESQENDQIIADVNITVESKLIWGKQNLAVEVNDLDFLGISLPKKFFTGKKVGDVCKKELTLPPEFKLEEYQNKQAELSFTISEIKKVKLPPLDDKFAVELACKDLAELKNKIRDQLKEQKEAGVDYTMEQELLNNLLNQTQISIGDQLIDSRVAMVQEQMRNQMLREGKAEDKIKSQLAKQQDKTRQDVIQQLKEFLIVEKIARQENIESTEEEVDEYIQSMAQHTHKWPNELRQEYEKKGMMEEIKFEVKMHKVLFLLRTHAKIQEAPSKQPGNENE